MSWTVSNGDLISENTVFISRYMDRQNFPSCLWRGNTENSIINMNNVFLSNYIDTSIGYPSSVWICNNGLTHNIDEPEQLGAFAHATHLSSVIIPRSVKSIGEYSFRNTALTSVTIASDCSYYPTSFPDNCTINTYSD